MTTDFNLDHLAEVGCVRFLHWKLLFPPFAFFTLWREVTLCSPRSEKEDWCSFCLKRRGLIHLWEFWAGTISIMRTHLFTDPIIYLYWYVPMSINLFKTCYSIYEIYSIVSVSGVQQSDSTVPYMTQCSSWWMYS